VATRYCKNCGFTGHERRFVPGSLGLEILLWLFLIVPGAIYSGLRRTRAYYGCPQCRAPNMVPLASAAAQSVYGQTTGAPIGVRCWHCGHQVADSSSVCSWCGARLFPNVVTGYPNETAVVASRQSMKWPTWIKVVSVLAVILLAEITTKLENQRSDDDANRKAAALNEHEREAKAAFDKMTPAQHLEQAQPALQPNPTDDQITEALRHLKAIPSAAPEDAKAKTLEQRLMALQKKRQDQSARARWQAEKDLAVLQAKLKRTLRDKMAKDMENSLLDEGFNVDVSAIGDDHTVLHLKWVLVDKAMAHNFSKQGDFFQNAREVGFKRIEITDGYESSWYWNLH
jgi:hypothetical protein